MVKWSDLTEEEKYVVYKLDRRNFVGNHQVEGTGLENIVRSSMGSEFTIDGNDAIDVLDNLKSKNVVVRYNDRDSWSLNPKFVNKHRDELDDLASEKSEINRIL